jgi:hypothetical protein
MRIKRTAGERAVCPSLIYGGEMKQDRNGITVNPWNDIHKLCDKIQKS